MEINLYRCCGRLLLMGLAGLYSVCVAAQDPALVVAEIVDIRGSVEVRSPESGSQPQPDWQPARPGQRLYSGDRLRTGTGGWTAILTSDETRMHVNQHSQLEFVRVAQQAGWLQQIGRLPLLNSLYRLFSGELFIENNNKNINIEVDAPTLQAGIRGTSFLVRVESQQLSVLEVFEGSVVATHAQNSRDQLSVGAGDRVIARAGQPLQLERLVVSPEDAVQWALLIPEPARSGAPLSAELQQARQDIRSGRLTQAQTRLETFSREHPRNADAWRLLALTRLSLNRKPQALRAAERAVHEAPGSAAALLTLSYVKQAFFDLEQAIVLTRRALAQEPGNIPAMIQLARLQFASDDPTGAWQTLTRALQRAPNTAEVQNLYGFLLLARQDSGPAIAAFRQAITLDPRAGEPHLGLGLAFMRLGDTEQALQEIAKAVLLQPRNSLLLSYWAKMLYQVRRFDKALQMLELAKTYDPQDPTPWLYESLILRDSNRPAAAIRALNRAVALNDRRAVFRSRFLLDRDLAVKNADLSRLYQDLGFTAWAKNKAGAAIRQDYTNASAHIFMAGVLAGDSERSWAQSGEALLGRLLQPGSINSFNNYNDYTALLEQPAVNGSFSIAHGTQGFWQSEGLIYGALPDARLAFGAIAGFSKDNGWRGDNGDRFDDVSAIAKWDVSPQDGLLFSISRSRFAIDDERYPRFEIDFPADPAESTDRRSNRYELGYHHHLAPRSDILLYLNYTDFRSLEKDHFRDSFSIGDFDTYIENDTDAAYYQAQAQYSVSLGRHQLIVGALHYRLADETDIFVDDRLLADDDSIVSQAFLNLQSDTDSHVQSYYLQDIWTLNEDWTLESAIYVERFKHHTAGTSWGDQKINPRIGAIWTPTPRDTLRIAGFRYLLPRISPRLDPMDVAGLTIYRNALEGSLAEEAALAWEHEWDSGFIATQLFYQQREFASDQGRAEGRSHGVEFELNQLLPWDSSGLVAKYRYLDSNDDAISRFTDAFQIADSTPPTDRQEHLFELEFNYLNEHGVSASVGQIYRRIDSAAAGRPDEDIWSTNLKFGYELPGKSAAIRFEVRNLFDQRFNWVTDPFAATSGIPIPAPARQAALVFMLNF